MKTDLIPKKPIVYVIGPTASGKTDIAIRLAKALNSEVISSDSRYLFRELSIGTAKPSPEELASIPHHLIDVTSVKAPWSLGEYLKAIEPIIENLNAQQKLPVLVGGTGQYYRAIVQGWQVPELPPNPELRAQIEAWGEEVSFETLHQKLALIDPQAAANIDHRNTRRTVRAWEVILSTGRRFSSQRLQGEPLYQTLTIGLDWDRETLYQRVDQRIDWMMKNGLLEEVQALINQGLAEDVKRIGVIGYAETIAYLQGEISLEDCIMLIKRHTRQFVRRQANWFKPNDPNIHWFKASDPASFEKMLDLIKRTF